MKIDPFETLLQHDDLFTVTNNFALYILRFLGWWILRILTMMITAVEQAVNALFQNIDFINSPEVMSLVDQLKPAAWGLMVVGVILLFYGLMTNRVKSKGQIPFNFICFFIIMVGLPSFLSELNQLTSAGINTFKDTSEASMAQTLLDNGIQDLYYYDQNNFSAEALDQRNNIPTDKIEYINPVELLRPNQARNPDVVGQQIGLDSNGNYQLNQLGDGLFGWEILSSYYYRYKVDWIPLFISLIAMLLALAFSAIKIGKIIFELGYNVYVLLFVSAIDLTSGERTKRVCSEILSLFLVLIAIALLFRVYIIGVSWVSRTFDGLAQAFAMLGFSWALIDGPNIIQKLFGIDAGLSSAFHTIMGVYQGARAVTGLAKGTARAAKAAKVGIQKAPRIAGGAAVAATAAGGYMAGRAQGFHEYAKGKQEASKNQGRVGPVYGYSSFGNSLEGGKQPPKLGGATESGGNPSADMGTSPHGGNPAGTPTPETGGNQLEHPEIKDNDNFRMDPSDNSTRKQSVSESPGRPGVRDNDSSRMDMPDSARRKDVAEPQGQPEAKNEQPNKSKERIPDRTTTLGGLVKGGLSKKFKPSRDKIQGVMNRSYDIGRNTAIKGLQNRDEMIGRLKNKLASAYGPQSPVTPAQQSAQWSAPPAQPSRPAARKDRRLPERQTKAIKEGGKKRGGNQPKS